MTLSALINHVGDAAITLQWLNSSILKAELLKSEGKVTFATDKFRTQQILTEFTGGKQADCACLIVWLPRDLMPEDIRKTV